MSRCCINFTLQLMQLKHISDPSVFKATNNAVEIRLNNSDRFLYMQHISDHHLSIYLIPSNNLLKHNLSFINPCLTFVEKYMINRVSSYFPKSGHSATKTEPKI